MDNRPGKIKVLIVDDSAFYRQTLSEMIITSSKMDVIGSVGDGTQMIQFLSNNSPDVIILDLEMPRMDGFTVLRWLMKEHPLPVLVVSARSGASEVFKALELGAVDFLGKPTQRASMEVLNIQNELIAKIETAVTISKDKIRSHYKIGGPISETLKSSPVSSGVIKRAKFEVVVIGASTGGPPAIQNIITNLPGNLPVILAVAQHMPPGFTQHFAQRLHKISELSVKEAKNGELAIPGNVYIAPGGYHLEFEKKTGGDIHFILKFRVESDKYTPSVDILMKSAARIFKEKAVGVLLTGMGYDGREGMRSIKEAGGMTMAESEETAVIFGMPKEAILAGAVDQALPLFKIHDEIVQVIS